MWIGIVVAILVIIFSPLILYFLAMLTVTVLVYGGIFAGLIWSIIAVINAFFIRIILRFAGRNVAIAYLAFWALEEKGIIDKNPIW